MGDAEGQFKFELVEDHNLPSLEYVILSEMILIEAYKKLMPYQLNQGREAQVDVFAGFMGVDGSNTGIYLATDVEDVTPPDTTWGGIRDSFASPKAMSYSREGKARVARFHSHPSGCACVSGTDRDTERRIGSSVSLASITPEGIITFFGNPNYKVCVTDRLKQIGSNQYQLLVNCF
jgi:proteasome lid subunit RPN8/RPN11